MKCNVKELALLSDAPCDIEGRLNYKKTSNGAILESVFKERWFRLVKNYLFYFKLSEMGKFDARNPAGVFVLENSSIQMEHGQAIPFAFSISFIEEPEKRHVLASRTQEAAVQWVMKLRASSYEYLRSQLHLLQSKIFAISGNDPLLMVPRNEGAKLWAPSVPFSTAAACTSTSGFSCHLHTNGHLSLDRSKSEAHLARRRHLQSSCNVTQTYVHTHSSARDVTDAATERTTDSGFALERSATVQHTILGSEARYTRPAPSPPVRRKPSPRLNRSNGDGCESPTLAHRSKLLATTGILEPAPAIPPRRKVSPKYLELSRADDAGAAEAGDAEDLIKF